MIIDKIIKINVSPGNISHLKSIGYNVKNGDIIEIPINHLTQNSHVKIKCKCDTCQKEKIMTYQCYRKITLFDDKYYCKYCVNEKRNKVLKIKYNVDNVFQLEQIKNLSKKTKIEKYGNEYYRNDNKIKETNLEKYGCENVFQNEDIKEKIKNNNVIKYGVEYPIQLENVKEKCRKTNLKKFGVEYAQQNNEIFHKSKTFLFKISEIYDIKYQGSYELNFLNFCENNNILYMISKGKSIKYIQYNKIHYYHPDFFIDKLNLIIEIKSKYWWDKHIEKNLIKQNSVKEQGYDYIIIMDKDYSKFKLVLDKIKLLN